MARYAKTLASTAVLSATLLLPATGHADAVGDLQAKIKDLDRRYQQQKNELEQLKLQLHALENRILEVRGKGAPPANAYAQQVQQEQGGAASSSAEASSAAATSNGTSEAPEKKPAPSRSAQAVYEQAQGTLFDRRFTFEPSLTYSRFDRRQIALNGFLALDAIFLGNIAVQETKADIWQLDLTGRYGITPRLQVYLDAPFLYRHTDYLAGGQNFSGTLTNETGVTRSPSLGDTSVGAYYELTTETESRPSVVANVALKLPTGTDPYGIKVITPTSNTNLQVPEALPTGNGVYTVFGGLSVLKTVDPVILFANAGIYHNFVRSFGDISTVPNQVTPGKVDLRNAFQWGAGVALALNEKTALTFSFSDLVSQAARTQVNGGTWQDIIGSDANSAVFNTGLTYALSDRETMITNVGVGLTPDAPNFQLTFKFPYTF